MNNRDTWEVTPQLWYRFFKGKQGTLQYGVEYEYIHREGWRGVMGRALLPPPVDRLRASGSGLGLHQRHSVIPALEQIYAPEPVKVTLTLDSPSAK